MIAMACLLPSRATTAEAAKVVMTVIKAAISTGGLGNAVLPCILSCIAVKRDTKASAGNGKKSNNAFNFFGFVIVFTSFLWLYGISGRVKHGELENAAGHPPHLVSGCAILFEVSRSRFARACIRSRSCLLRQQVVVIHEELLDFLFRQRSCFLALACCQHLPLLIRCF